MPESKANARPQALTAQRYKQLRHDVQQLISSRAPPDTPYDRRGAMNATRHGGQ